MYNFIDLTNCSHPIQGGEDPYDALSCRSLSAKAPVIIGFFCGKWPVKIRHPMGLGTSVKNVIHHTHIWISHDLYQWVKSYTNESYLICRKVRKKVIHTYEQVMTYTMSHVLYECVRFDMGVLRLIGMCHVLYEWVMSEREKPKTTWAAVEKRWRIDQMTSQGHSELMPASRHTYEWVMSYINASCLVWMSHVARMNESCQGHSELMPASCHTYEWVMSHINESCLVWMSHVTRMNESFQGHSESMPQSCLLRMSHVPRMNESDHTYEWVMSRMNEPYHTHEWVMSGPQRVDASVKSHVSPMNESCLIWTSHVS